MSVGLSPSLAAELLTPRVDGHAQLLYFTSPSTTADNRFLVHIVEKDGCPDLWLRDLAAHTSRQITHSSDGYLKSYVYFDGAPDRGLGKASVSLDPFRGRIYYLQGRDLCLADLEGSSRGLAQLPDDEVTAFTHVSRDGRLLCVPTTDADALSGPFEGNRPTYNIDARVRERGLSSYLNIYDTTSGERLARERVPDAWITHVQFSPRDPSLILYNHEWPSDCGVRRMWLWDGRSHRPLRDADQGRSRADWVCHEMWDREGKNIIYHGRFADAHDRRSFVGIVDLQGGRRSEIALAPGYDGYGHFTTGAGDTLVTDGYYRTDEDDTRLGRWISLVEPDWTTATLRWRPLCRHGSSWSSQDAHPHPVFDHAGESVLFTSDASGHRRIYCVRINAR